MTATPTVSAVEGLRLALQRIAEYETNWTEGPAANVSVLQAIAEQALARWHSREPLREDGAFRDVACKWLVGYKYTEPANADVVSSLLDAIDSHLSPGRLPEKGEPSPKKARCWSEAGVCINHGACNANDGCMYEPKKPARCNCPYRAKGVHELRCTAEKGEPTR